MQFSPQVDAFCTALKQPQKDIVQALRTLILEAAPGIEERLSHRIPFYFYHGRVFYISVYPNRVTLGFCRGNSLADEHGLLSGNQQTVRHYHLVTLADLKPKKLTPLLHEALLLNESLKRKN